MSEWFHRRSQPIVYFVLFAFACFCAGSLYFMFWEPSYLSYPTPVKPLVETVSPGEVLPVDVHRVNREKITRSYTSTRELHCDTLNAPVILLGGPPNQVAKGETTVPNFTIVIPERVSDDPVMPSRPMPAGTCWIQGEAETQGLIRAILVPWRTTMFRVVARAPYVSP